MSGVLGLLQLLVLALLGSLGLGAIAGHAVARVVLPALVTWAARERYQALWVLSALPALVGTSVFGAMLAPSFAALAFPGLDHCFGHEDVHAHLCFVHLPMTAGDPRVWLVLALGVLPIGAAALRALNVLRRSSRLVRGLLSASSRTEHRKVRLVPSTRPLCMSVGLFKPEIAISEGLVASLDSSAMQVLMAHEGAHVARRDAARQLVADLLSVLHTPGLRRRLLGELSLAAEEICDQAAATAVGDRLLVADTILRVARLGQDMPPSPCVAYFGATATERRVEALLDPEPSEHPLRLVVGRCATVAALLAIFALSDELHDAVESVLSIFHV